MDGDGDSAAGGKKKMSRIILREQMDVGPGGGEALTPSFDVTYGGSGSKLSKFARNPLVPIGSAVTAGILVAGLLSFRAGNTQLSQQLMRARVLAQGATLGVLSLSVARMQQAAGKGGGGH